MHPLETAVPGAGRKEAGLCSLLLPPGVVHHRDFAIPKNRVPGSGCWSQGTGWWRMGSHGQPEAFWGAMHKGGKVGAE